MKPYDYVVAVLLIGLICGAAYFLLPAYKNYSETKGETRELQTTISELSLESRDLQQDIHDLQTDPRAVERVAREKFGWCQDNEKIYHFDPAPKTTSSAPRR
ncbi:MAG: septum formation initiator family protein [Candidatus Pacebacteria bacterium]|nr:septum formation initiator family protein [Candidatus Paceibacterota bacterium]